MCFEAIQKLDEKNIPTSMDVWHCIVAPDQYYQLANVDKLVNRDFSRDNGDFGKGTVYQLVVFQLLNQIQLQKYLLKTYHSAISGTNNTL